MGEFSFDSLIGLIREVDPQFVSSAVKAVNVSQTMRSWCVGAYIAEFELCGADRAVYGERLFVRIAANVKTEGDNLPVGLVLCPGKDDGIAEYATAGFSHEVFVSKYEMMLSKVEDVAECLAGDGAGVLEGIVVRLIHKISDVFVESRKMEWNYENM